MHVAARHATADDLPELVRLYRLLETEMVALHAMWPKADGLAEPVDASLAAMVADASQTVLVGELDGVPLGFLYGYSMGLLPQAGDARVASIRLVFVELDAREVAIGEAMRDEFMRIHRESGHTLFDAHVLPGHRLAKNFFEAGGFSARSIIMHHDDNRIR